MDRSDHPQKIVKREWICLFLFSGSLAFGKSAIEVVKEQVLFSMQSGDVERGVDLYERLVNETGGKELSTLEEIGHILLQRGITDRDEESQLLSMYGTYLAESEGYAELYRMGIASRHLSTQMATVQFLNLIKSDWANEILLGALSSPFPQVQMEAARALATKRISTATGALYALMESLPLPYRSYFPELFAMIGSDEASSLLCQLVEDSDRSTRLSALLAIARFERDDCLELARDGLTHTDPGERETCAITVGFLKDAASIPQLKRLAEREPLNVKLAACYSLFLLGEEGYQQGILQSASDKQLMAIPLLADIPSSEALLLSLAEDSSFQVRINAALALLKKRHPASIPTLLQILIKGSRDWGFYPSFSPGHSLMMWRAIPSSTQYAERFLSNIPAISLELREWIARECLELPSPHFLTVARALFEHRQNDLIPLLIHLIENQCSSEGIALLERGGRQMGNPLARIYCHLALYRLKREGPHADILQEFAEKSPLLIRFRPTSPRTERLPDSPDQLLTPEESSRLLVEILMAFAESRDERAIPTLLNILRKPPSKNHPIIAGLLLKATQ